MTAGGGQTDTKHARAFDIEWIVSRSTRRVPVFYLLLQARCGSSADRPVAANTAFCSLVLRVDVPQGIHVRGHVDRHGAPR